MVLLGLAIGCLLLWIAIEVTDTIDDFYSRRRTARRELIFERIKNDYRFSVAQKDLVRLPSGVLGVVIDIDFFIGGNSKRVRVLTVERKYIDFYDKDINLLEKISSLEKKA